MGLPGTALEKTADYTYDCILLDIMLPDGNGLDLQEELKKENKKEKIQKIADDNGMKAIVEGSNLDDNGDYRPGLQAVAELGIKSPLRHCDLSKADIRALSHYLHLPTWEKQSFACLSSRFVYGETITEEKLGMVDKAEQLLLNMGFHQVRVRIHGMMARIEIEPSEFG